MDPSACAGVAAEVVAEPSDLRRVFEVAFRRVDAHVANVEIEAQRESYRDLYGHALSFEVLLEAEQTLTHLAEHVLPRLTFHLKSKRLRAPRAAGVFVSLFVGTNLFFIEGRAFFETIRVAMGWDDAELARRIERWETDIP